MRFDRQERTKSHYQHTSSAAMLRIRENGDCADLTCSINNTAEANLSGNRRTRPLASLQLARSTGRVQRIEDTNPKRRR